MKKELLYKNGSKLNADIEYISLGGIFPTDLNILKNTIFVEHENGYSLFEYDPTESSLNPKLCLEVNAPISQSFLIESISCYAIVFLNSNKFYITFIDPENKTKTDDCLIVDKEFELSSFSFSHNHILGRYLISFFTEEDDDTYLYDLTFKVYDNTVVDGSQVLNKYLKEENQTVSLTIQSSADFSYQHNQVEVKTKPSRTLQTGEQIYYGFKITGGEWEIQTSKFYTVPESKSIQSLHIKSYIENEDGEIISNVVYLPKIKIFPMSRLSEIIVDFTFSAELRNDNTFMLTIIPSVTFGTTDITDDCTLEIMKEGNKTKIPYTEANERLSLDDPLNVETQYKFYIRVTKFDTSRFIDFPYSESKTIFYPLNPPLEASDFVESLLCFNSTISSLEEIIENNLNLSSFNGYIKCPTSTSYNTNTVYSLNISYESYPLKYNENSYDFYGDTNTIKVIGVKYLTEEQHFFLTYTCKDNNQSYTLDIPFSVIPSIEPSSVVTIPSDNVYNHSTDGTKLISFNLNGAHSLGITGNISSAWVLKDRRQILNKNDFTSWDSTYNFTIPEIPFNKDIFLKSFFKITTDAPTFVQDIEEDITKLSKLVATTNNIKCNILTTDVLKDEYTIYFKHEEKDIQVSLIDLEKYEDLTYNYTNIKNG